MLGLFTPIFYIQLYAINHGLNKSLAFYTVTILNGASVVRSDFLTIQSTLSILFLLLLTPL